MSQGKQLEKSMWTSFSLKTLLLDFTCKEKSKENVQADFSGLELSDCSLNQFESRYSSEFTI